jgi:hypothetical protein
LRNNAKILGIGILIAGLTLWGALPLSTARAAVLPSGAPAALSLSPIPPKLPADNNTYPGVVVSVVTAGGLPTVATADINVSLTSSQENVGKIVASVVILAGETYAVANFTTTHTAGVTTVTATTTGLATAKTAVTTVVAVGYPTHLVMTAVPDTLPASTASTGYLILELEDDVGLPAKAITDVPISLYSSNTDVVNITTAATVMKQGEYLKEINYTSGFVPGSAAVTASATGFASGTATISVLGSPPLALSLQAQPSLMVACTTNVTSCDGRLVVTLTDLSGNPTRATRDIYVQIRSSDLAVANAVENTTIQEGNISAIAIYTVTATSVVTTPAGSYQTVVTASSPGLKSSFATITVVDPALIGPQNCNSAGSTTCQLELSASPNPVLADHRSYSSVVVSLESTPPLGSLTPAVDDTGATNVTLTSSVTGVGNFTSITFAIPQGENWASVTFTSTYQVGVTELTASAQNFLSVQTSLGTYGPVPSQVVVSAISTPLPADGATHPALELSLEDAFGSPAVAASDIPVSLSSSQAEVVSVADAVIPAGQAFAIVNVTAGILQGTANVTALVSSFTAGYASSSVNLSTVIPAPSSLSASAPDADIVMFTPASAHQFPILAVQLQDSKNNPARARAPMNITVTSSNSTVISKVSTAVIPVGQDYASFPLAANVPGETTLTVSTPGLATASILITFLASPNVDTITGGPATIFTTQSSIISVSVALEGSPLEGAPVYWNASSGGLIISTPPSSNSSSAITTSTSVAASSSVKSTKSTTAIRPTGLSAVNDTTDKAGSSTAIFYPTKTGSVLITALVAPKGLLAKTLNFTVQVTAAPPTASVTKHKASLVQELTTFPLLLVPIGGAGGAVAAVFLIRKRRGGGGAKSDADFDTSFE